MRDDRGHRQPDDGQRPLRRHRAPDVTTAEQNDIIQQGSSGNMGYSIFASRAIEPVGDSMPIYDQLTGIAEKLGVKEEFTEGRTQDEWLDWILDQSRASNIPDLPRTKSSSRWVSTASNSTR